VTATEVYEVISW